MRQRRTTTIRKQPSQNDSTRLCSTPALQAKKAEDALQRFTHDVAEDSNGGRRRDGLVVDLDLSKSRLSRGQRHTGDRNANTGGVDTGVAERDGRAGGGDGSRLDDGAVGEAVGEKVSNARRGKEVGEKHT